ncbi:MAG: DUF4147 domain-containing protein [Acidobacteriota bacterium]
MALTSALRGFLAGWAPEAVAPPILGARFARKEAPDRVLCLGKAAPGLAAAARAVWPGVPGLLYGVPGEPGPPGFLDLRGDHPEPSPENLGRTRQVLDWLREGRGALLALVSGGASALLVAPRPPWTLAEKAALASQLLLSGASVRDVNAVRAALSDVKGGGILKDLGRWPCATGIWSDVGSGQARLTGSGPTLPWTPAAPAGEVLRSWGIRAPRPLPPPRPRVRRPSDRWFLLADGVSMRRRAAEFLRGQGLITHEVPVGEGEGAEALAARIFSLAGAALRGAGPSRAWVGAGEATVAAGVHGGAGGRCSHLAASLALLLRKSEPSARWAFSALATDGMDGSGDGGAFTDRGSVPDVSALTDALARRATASLWRREGTFVPREPTGNNLRDLWVLVVG